MNYLSVCSGIEAATVAWHPLGWNPVGFGEIEKFPSQVLAHHYPEVPNFGDMTKFKEWQIESDVNVLVGGTPCQSFSVAGLRKGLDDPRGNLMLTYLAIAAKHRPKWLVWENVPGVLSSADGRDFGSFLGGLAILGYGFAYRVLDAQYFGVAQRRRRVFVVGCLGNWQCAAAVLFERHSLCGYPAPSRENGKSIAPSTSSSTNVSDYDVAGTLDKGVPGRGIGHNGNYDSQVVPIAFAQNQRDEVRIMQVAGALAAEPGMKQQTYLAQPIALAENTIGRKPENGGNGDGFTENGPMYTLNATGVHGVAQPVYELHSQDSRVRELGDVCSTVSATYGAGGGNVPITFSSVLSNQPVNAKSEVSQTLEAKNPTAVAQAMAVRRLTPTECERLQGFPDGYTDIKHGGKSTPDGPRYKALGNSMAVPVMAWIGQRIQQVENIV